MWIRQELSQTLLVIKQLWHVTHCNTCKFFHSIIKPLPFILTYVYSEQIIVICICLSHVNDTKAVMAQGDANNNNEGLQKLIDLILREANMTVTDDLLQKLTGLHFVLNFFKVLFERYENQLFSFKQGSHGSWNLLEKAYLLENFWILICPGKNSWKIKPPGKSSWKITKWPRESYSLLWM